MIKFCSKCLVPNTRPRIEFIENICNACIHSENKKKTDWKKRKLIFLNIIDDIKNNKQKNNYYDCVVPWSGGKDSTSIALKLKNEFNLNPLLVTFSPLIKNEIGVHNREILIKEGFDTILINVDEKISSYLAKRFFIERGNPKVAWDAGINSSPVKIAIKYNIPYIFYAEHAESEYGGLTLNDKSQQFKQLEEVIEHQIGDYPQNWIDNCVSEKKLYPYIYPEESSIKHLKIFYFSYFFKWSMYENWLYVKEKLPKFMTAENGRTNGTFTNFDSLDDKMDDLYYYMQYIKFGFGRATRDASRMIQNGHLTRKQGLEFVKEYDSEYPHKYLDDVLYFLKISKEDLDQIIVKHRNQEIWKLTGNNNWELKHKVNG